MDRATIAYYDAEAPAYADMTARGWPERAPWARAFAARLAAGARGLDLGCGPGQDAARFRAMGVAVDAMDASDGLAAEARRRHGIELRVARFDALDADAVHDDVWAAFSLLHDSRAALPGHPARIARALAPQGVLYLGMKEGDGTRRDRPGRAYIFVTGADVTGPLVGAGLAADEIGHDAAAGMAGSVDPCLHVLATHAREDRPS